MYSHSSLTSENRQELERVQKAALKVILKSDYNNYENALKMSGLQSLDDRREVMSLKFAKNCLKNANFKKLFPKNVLNHRMEKRHSFKYIVNRARTERLRKSSIPYMQEQLNTDNRKRKLEIENLHRVLDKSKRVRYCSKDPLVQVNYVKCYDYHQGK